MKKRTKLLIAIPLGLVGVLVLGGFIYFHFFFKFDLFKPGPIKGVSEEAWAKLRVGMTKQEVIALLGESDDQSGQKTMMDSNGQKKFAFPEFWQYTWSDGLALFGPSDKAHVIWFDSEGRVSDFRAPKTSEPSKQSMSRTRVNACVGYFWHWKSVTRFCHPVPEFGLFGDRRRQRSKRESDWRSLT